MSDDLLAGRGAVLIGAALRNVEQVDAAGGYIVTLQGRPPIRPCRGGEAWWGPLSGWKHVTVLTQDDAPCIGGSPRRWP